MFTYGPQNTPSSGKQTGPEMPPERPREMLCRETQAAELPEPCPALSGCQTGFQRPQEDPGLRDQPEPLSSSPCPPGVAPLRTIWPCSPGGTWYWSASWFAWDPCRCRVVLGEPRFTSFTLQGLLVWTMGFMNSLVGDDLEQGLREFPWSA